MKRRTTLKKLAWGVFSILAGNSVVYAKTYLTLEQARKALWGNTSMTKIDVTLSSAQAKSIKKASGVRVRNPELQIWKTSDGGWFILDQVIGKHENIDVVFALTNSGKVKGLEVLVYRESYGHEIMNPRWKAQFHGKGPSTNLKLDRDIQNITGATLSCNHITQGINRITHTWDQVLRHL